MRSLALFLTGAALGTLFDALHIYQGATFYTHPTFFKIAWWGPVAFGLAAWTIGSISVILHRWTGELRSPSWLKAMAGPAYLGLFFLLSGALANRPMIVLSLLVAGIAGAWLVSGAGKASLCCGLIAALGGPASEALMIRLKMFSYAYPQWMGLPYWTFALFFLGGIAIGPLAAKLLRPAPHGK